MKRVLTPLVALVALLALNRFLPTVLNPYYFQVLILVGINITLAVSLNLVNGFTGQFSIGHAGFMAAGAYGSAMFTVTWGQKLAAAMVAAHVSAPVAQGALLLVSLLLGGGLAAIFGYLVGLPSLRLRGDYLAIVTLGFGEIIRVLILNIDAVGGARGLPGIPQWANFFWVFLVATIVIALAVNLANSTHGRALFAIRDDEIAAEALGVDTTAYKVTAFVLGAFFAGVAGGLFAHYLSYLNPSTFTFLKSIEVIAMVVLGGMGSITGSVLAAIVLTLLPEALRAVKDYRMVIYALMLIILMITRPQGLMGTRELSWALLTGKKQGGRS
ncbi:MAG: branched-chain amino acid ABC transporter permease [Candidatus Eisenbacteria bacterium]|uniref:Branched-chain amino acid ABC transporter permease n=1 Tax=Eiseniibacteriota bacterium TaxID=2212470 RepID=A0A933SG35_UNCEI|nr:branched-chain amino acid ABC transporter permease [Candidatus Eisenbacteria bacterium]